MENTVHGAWYVYISFRDDEASSSAILAEATVWQYYFFLVLFVVFTLRDAVVVRAESLLFWKWVRRESIVNFPSGLVSILVCTVPFSIN